jgi:hypothetical protein
VLNSSRKNRRCFVFNFEVKGSDGTRLKRLLAEKYAF